MMMNLFEGCEVVAFQKYRSLQMGVEQIVFPLGDLFHNKSKEM